MAGIDIRIAIIVTVHHYASVYIYSTVYVGRINYVKCLYQQNGTYIPIVIEDCVIDVRPKHIIMLNCILNFIMLH